jgi:hypothetical protein
VITHNLMGHGPRVETSLTNCQYLMLIRIQTICAMTARVRYGVVFWQVR